jgi:sulfite oxidase
VLNCCAHPLLSCLQLRVVVPGFVGTRSVKWLKRITLSDRESESPWQQKDYKLMPQRFTTLSAADWKSMPPIMVSPTNSVVG